MNYKIVIDSGHGGVDSGAIGNGIVEKDLTLKISEYIYERLNELGIPVVMTRTTDETVNPDERVRRVLDAYGDNSNVLVISNHINAGGGDGAEVIYALRNNDKFSNIILNNMKLAGQNIRKAYQKRLPSNPSKDYYFMHRNTGKTEPVIIEYGFLDSKSDDVNQLKNNYQKLAEATVKSIAEYINVPYTLPSDNIENIYIVKSGDSLWSIAKRYGLTIDEIKRLNNLYSNLISVGQKLIVSENNVEETILDGVYIVQSGDTLYSIARKLNTTVQDLTKFNNLTSDILSIGQQLIIPTNTTNNYVNYTVKKGDNLYSIAKSYNVKQQDIMRLNNLTSNLLSIGQILKIPVNEITTTYVVKNGDTLYSIAREFNTTIQNIKNKNDLESDILSIGQTLII